jgi:hypothetical protein
MVIKRSTRLKLRAAGIRTAERLGKHLTKKSLRFQKTIFYNDYIELHKQIIDKSTPKELITSKYYGSWEVDINGAQYTELIDITVTRYYEISKHQFKDFIETIAAKLKKMKWILKKPTWQHGIERGGQRSEDEAVMLRKNGRMVKRWEFMENEIRGYFPRGA